MSVIKSIIAEVHRWKDNTKDKTHAKRYRDVPLCTDEKNLFRFIYDTHGGINRPALVGDRSLRWGEGYPGHAGKYRDNLYSLNRRYNHRVRSLCQKPSPENPEYYALYASFKGDPDIGVSRGRFNKVERCRLPLSQLRRISVTGDGKTKTRLILTAPPLSVLARGERAVQEKDVKLAKRFIRAYGADGLCRYSLSRRHHLLMYEYLYAKRLDGTVKPYAGVPVCGEGQKIYRILKSELKRGEVQVGLNRVGDGLFLWQHDLHPKKDVGFLNRLREKYVSDFSFVERVIRSAASPEKLLAWLQPLRNHIDAASRTRICQSVVRGARDCVSRSDAKDCKHARFGLFLEMALPVANLNDFMREPLPKSMDDRVAFFDLMQQSLPPAMRKCMNLNAFQEVYEDMRRRGMSYDQAKTDWAAIDAATTPLADRIEVMMPSNTILAYDRRRYLMKIIAAGQEAIDSDDEIAEIAQDVADVSKSVDEYLYKFQAVIVMRYALMLHRENMKDHGVGISNDFEAFVRMTERSIRRGRIHFRVKNAGEDLGPLAMYDSITNTVKLPPLDTDMPVLFYWMENIVHELYHSAQDEAKLRLTMTHAEGKAYERGIKASILLMRRIERTKGVRFPMRPWEISRDLSNALQQQGLEGMKCMGWNEDHIKQQQKYGEQLMELHADAVSGFGRELKGKRDVEAYHAILGYIQSTYWMGHVAGASFGEQVTLGWLKELGFSSVLRYRRNGALANLIPQYFSTPARFDTRRQAQRYAEMLADYGAITSAEFYMNGAKFKGKPDDAIAKWGERLFEEFQKTAYVMNGL